MLNHDQPKPASGTHHGSNSGGDEPGCTIRTFRRADAGDVDRLAGEGLLPGQLDYETTDPAHLEYLGSERERFWIAEMDGRIVGTVAIAEVRERVGHLHWLRVVPVCQSDRRVARRLVQVAAAHAREMGLLKLVMHVPGSAQSRVADYLHLLGFEFSRNVQRGGRDMLEFYVNLYEQPKLRDGAQA